MFRSPTARTTQLEVVMHEPILPQIIPIPHTRIKDITGQRFERIIALGYVGPGPGGKAIPRLWGAWHHNLRTLAKL